MHGKGIAEQVAAEQLAGESAALVKAAGRRAVPRDQPTLAGNLLLAVSAGAVVAALSRRSVPLAAGLFIACGWLTPVAPQVAVLLDDVSPERESRRTAGEYIAANVPLDAAIGLIQEPAPYATPPLDFTRRRVVLLPPASGAETAEELPPWLVLTHDTLSPPAGAWWLRHYALVRTFPEDGRRVSPISWASKPVQLYRLME